MHEQVTRRRRYSMSEFGHPDRATTRGNYLLKSGRGTVWRPTWGDGGTTVRILPGRDPTDRTRWDPYRFSLRPLDFGDWIRKYPVCRQMGDADPVTFISYDPTDPTLSRDHVRTTPGWILYHAIERAVAAGQDQPGWGALLKGGPMRAAALPPPTEVYLMQVFIVQSGGRVYAPPKGFGPDERAVVLEITRATGQTLFAELDRMKPDVPDCENDDWESLLVHGDPVSLEHGRFVTFYNLKRDPRRQETRAASWNEPSGSTASRDDRAGFGVYVETTFQGMSARLAEYEETVAAKVQNWDEILYFPTIEEQAQLLAERFPPNAILYAWRDHPEWIPETVRRRAVNARTFPSVTVPAYQEATLPQIPPAEPVTGWGIPQPAHEGDIRPSEVPGAPFGATAVPVPGVGPVPATGGVPIPAPRGGAVPDPAIPSWETRAPVPAPAAAPAPAPAPMSEATVRPAAGPFEPLRRQMETPPDREIAEALERARRAARRT